MITGYHKGDKVYFTKKSEWVYGELFFEVRFIDGAKYGQTEWVSSTHIANYTPEIHKQLTNH